MGERRRGEILRIDGIAREECDHDAEELRLALRHLEPGFMSRFTRFVFNPANPFIAGAGVLASVVAAQTAYLQSTYIPLPPPDREVSCGYVPYEGSERSQGLRRVLILGDSLVTNATEDFHDEQADVVCVCVTGVCVRALLRC